MKYFTKLFWGRYIKFLTAHKINLRFNSADFVCKSFPEPLYTLYIYLYSRILH